MPLSNTNIKHHLFIRQANPLLGGQPIAGRAHNTALGPTEQQLSRTAAAKLVLRSSRA